MKTCPNCGAQNHDEAVFCPNCKTPYTPAGQQPPAAAPQAQSPQQQVYVQQGQSQPGGYTPGPQQSSQFDVKKLMFMQTAVNYVSHGSLFRRIVSGFIWAVAVLSGIGAAVMLIGVAGGFFSTETLPGVLGGLLSIPLVLIYGYAIVHTLIIRAHTIRDLPDSEYTVIPIVGIMLKLGGETSAIYLVYLGIQMAIAAWFGGPAIGGMGFLYYTDVGSSFFLLGAVSIIGGLLTGFFTLLTFYLISEAVFLFVDIARDVRAMREAATKNA